MTLTDDKYVPTQYVGKIEANYYCRGWNAKRNKYCKSIAGTGTDHKGEGRCKKHGGTTPIKTGRYSKVTRSRIAELISDFEKDKDPLKLLEEVHLLRAMLVDYIERYDEISEALIVWHLSFSKDYQRIYSEWQNDWLEAIANPHNKSPDEILPPPLPNDGKPKQILDIIQAKTLVDSIVKTVDTIIKHETGQSITMETFSRLLNQYSLGVLTAAQETIEDEHIRSELIKCVQSKWNEVRAE